MVKTGSQSPMSILIDKWQENFDFSTNILGLPDFDAGGGLAKVNQGTDARVESHASALTMMYDDAGRN